MVQGFQVRVLVVDNDPFTLTLVTEALAAANFAVSGVPTVPDAISTIESFSPNVLVTDLNFGHGAPTGADLLTHVDEHHPWIGKVVLTSHLSASLALPIGNQLTDGAHLLDKKPSQFNLRTCNRSQRLNHHALPVNGATKTCRGTTLYQQSTR